MKLFKLFKINDNKGLSIVELLAAITVASLVVIGCGAFMVSASKYFSRESAETTMQEEAQLVKNLLNNVVVDTQLAIGRVTNWDADAADGTMVEPQPTLIVFGKEKIFFLGYDAADTQKMYYMEKDAKDVVNRVTLEGGGSKLDIDRTAVGAMKDWEPLADHLKDFTITLDRINKNARIFNCTMDFELRNRTYKTSHTITLRNNILDYNGDVAQIYSGNNTLDPTVTGVYITPSNIALPLDGDFKFESSVSGLNYPPQSVTWAVEGDGSVPLSTDTIIDEYGNLHISDMESCQSLKVTATSTFDPNYVGIAFVPIGSLNSLTLLPTAKAVPDDEGKYNLGQTVPFQAILQGKYVEDKSITINWSVTKLIFPAVGTEGSAGYQEEQIFQSFDDPDKGDVDGKAEIAKYVRLTANGAECSMYISPQARPGARITLQAIANMGGKTQTDNYTIEVSSKSAGDLILYTDGTELKRNGMLRVRATVIGFDNEEIEWSISNNYGGRVTMPAKSVSGQEIEIRANNALDYGQKYTFTLTAKAVASTNITEKTESRVITIKPVSISFKENPVYVVVGQPARVPVIVEGLEAGGQNATYRVMKYVRNLVSPYYANGNLVIAVTPPSGSQKLPDYQGSTIQATLKNVGTVTGNLSIHVFNSNIIIEGYNYCYVPVPGDKSGLFPASADNESLPTNGSTRTINGITYTYYVNDSVPSKTWGIMVDTPGGKTLRYLYKSGKFELVNK
ncbi:MAG: hypothetical protein MJ134_09720 [Lachnospiraceae bacterium]|nr:hypothetical protein [Lachnospiraceae bacterium]